MTITLSLPAILVIIVGVIGLIWVLTRDNFDSFLGSDRSWAWVLYIVTMSVLIVTVGGIFWW